LPPSSSVSFFRLPRAAPTMSLPTSVEPVKGDLVDAGMGGQRSADGLAEAGDDVDDAGGQPRLDEEFAEPQGRQRGFLGGLEHDGAARGQRRRELHSSHQQRRVPRGDRGDHADRLAAGIGEDLPSGRLMGDRRGDRRPQDLGRIAGKVSELFGRSRDFAEPCRLQRLALVEHFEFGEFVGMALDEVADAPEQPAAGRGGHAAPGIALESGTGGSDGVIRVRGGAFGEPRQKGAVRRIEGFEDTSVRRVAPDTADEDLLVGAGQEGARGFAGLRRLDVDVHAGSPAVAALAARSASAAARAPRRME
jgi:hypothetical protein